MDKWGEQGITEAEQAELHDLEALIAADFENDPLRDAITNWRRFRP